MPESPLRETFRQPALDSRLSWRGEPTRWTVDVNRGCLRVEPDAATDFWQRTHYGFRVDNGHFLFAEVAGDFVLTTHVRFEPVHQYDQAGLMVRLSADCWLKTSVEYEPGAMSRLGVVVTNHGYSDWSMQDIPSDRRAIWLRVRRTDADYLVEASADGTDWTQLRVAHLQEDTRGRRVQAGLYACSPRGTGFVAEFDLLHLEPALGERATPPAA